MIRKLPLIPTILVGFAIAAMIGLGIWQLGRAREKDALIAQYAAARNQPPIAFPPGPLIGEPPLFRKATGLCLQPISKRVLAGRNREGETGFVHVVTCRTGAEGPGMAVQIGWSRDPQAPVQWRGGEVSGTIAPDSKYRMRLVLDGAVPGLKPSAPPSIEQIPNNHRLYAVQWFLFAAIAGIIFVLAARRRGAAKEQPRP